MSHGESHPAVFTHEIIITDEVIDGNGHVNNVAYVQWMQDAAVGHSRACIERGKVRQMGCTWVARSHHIEYLRPAFCGDRLIIRTWLASIRRVRCLRRYEFIRAVDEELEQFTKTGRRAGLVAADDLLPKTVSRGHKSAKFAVIATGETDWVFVNANTGRPGSIPEEIRSAFQFVADPDAT